MEPVPPDSSPLCLARGEIVLYPTARPSIRVLTQQIAALGYEVSWFPLQQTDLRQLPPGVWHRVVVIGGHIYLLSSPGRCYLLSIKRNGRRQNRRRSLAVTALPRRQTGRTQTTSTRTSQRTAPAPPCRTPPRRQTGPTRTTSTRTVQRTATAPPGRDN